MLVADGNGTPMACHLDSAQISELDLGPIALDKVSVRTKSGRVRKRPDKLIADKGYDARRFRKYVRNKGMKMCIPPQRRAGQYRKRGRPYKVDMAAYNTRWHIERAFAWVGNFRRLVVRYENILGIYQGFFHIACFIICLSVLLK